MNEKTFREVAFCYLTSHGMFERQADEVMAELENSDDSMARWSDRASDYPEVMTKLVILATKKAAIRWIDRCQPRAWYRQMFV